MSLLSKALPESFKNGICNVGFLSTEAGMIGRSVGDLFISFCGRFGLEHLLNALFSTLLGLGLLSLVILQCVYDYLDPKEKDD